MLTFKIPGVSFFEIQPDRFLFFLFAFFLARNLLFPNKDIRLPIGWSMPWFKIFIYIYVFLVISSQVFHVNDNGAAELITNTVYALNILLFMYCVRVMTDEETIRIIGSALIIGAIFASITSIIQFLIDPMFLRVGDQRIAFGSTLRSNGLFINEYLNAYLIITALAWVLITYKDGVIKYLLYVIFSVGVICSFQRMSWLILSIVSFIYFTQIRKISFSRLLAVGLVGLSILITVFMLFRADIMNSTLVKQRLSEPIDSRAGYYTTALDNVGKKPIFGFGGKNNDVYYYSMLMITSNRDRATGVAGDFHSGYFSTMFYYGLLAFLAFVGIVVTTIGYFGSLLKTHLIFSIPFLVALLFGVGNLTNTFLLDSYLCLILAIHLGIGQKLKELYTTSNGTHELFLPSNNTKA
ncbi:MAG: hypothetical protein ACI8X3_001453 [Saprospiraceae bacterium]